MALLSTDDIRGLRAELAGEVLLPNDSAYGEARSIWNGAIDRRPAAVVRCATAEDVAAAIGFARSRGLEIAVRGGGHNFAGFASCEGGLMISLSGLRGVAVDVDARRAVCGGGATWGDVDAATQEHGLATVGGFVSHTGIAGLTLGGGIGWLTRKAGLTVDNLLAAEVVTADGRVLRASTQEHPDLFWALRGGGGNFGVVTSFEYRLHRVGPLVQLGLFFWGVDRGAEALRFSRDFARTVPADMGLFVAGLSAPPEPFVPPEHHFAPGFALIVVGFGSAEEHAGVAERVRASMPPLFDLVTPMPYTALQQMFNAGVQWGVHAYEKALYLDDLTDGAIDVFADFVPRKQSPLSMTPVFIVDGAYQRVGQDETAFGGSRQARVVFNIAAICPTPELYQSERAWVRAFWEALRPHASNAGGYVNFMNEYEEDRVRAAYGPAKYDRLARIKATYDPDNLFHLNANIKPAPGPG
ncbi:MAG TPA: FAD-binding oxidoreductase [Chloroflexota bacterium]|jgi:FAD/FMN-containing dehydrogenase